MLRVLFTLTSLLLVFSVTNLYAATDEISTVIQGVSQPYLCVVKSTESVLVEDNPESGTRIKEFSSEISKLSRKIKKVQKALRAKPAKKKRKKLRKKKKRFVKDRAGIKKCRDRELTPALVLEFSEGTGSLYESTYSVSGVTLEVRLQQAGEGITAEGGFTLDEAPENIGQFEVRAERTAVSEDGLAHTYKIRKATLNVSGTFQIINDVTGTFTIDYSNLPDIEMTLEASALDDFDNSGGAFSFTTTVTLPEYDDESSYGDVDSDGDNDIVDFLHYQSCYGKDVTLPENEECIIWDANDDGTVNFADHLLIWASGFQASDLAEWTQPESD